MSVRVQSFIFLQICLHEFILNCQSIILPMIKSVKQAYQDQQEQGYQFLRDHKIVSIRKTARQQRFQKTRNSKLQKSSHLDATFYHYNQTEATSQASLQEQEKIKNFSKQIFTAEMLPSLSEHLKSANMMDVHLALIGIRKLLSAFTPPITQILSLQIDDTLLEMAASQFLQPPLQYQIAWCLMNLTYYCQQLNTKFVDKGLIQIFLRFLTSDRIEIVEIAMWGISNLASDSVEVKCKLLQQNGIEKIINNVMQRFQSQRAIEIACCGIAEFYFGQPLQNHDLLRSGIKLVSCMLENNCISDPDILCVCIHAIFQHCFQVSQKEHYQQIITRELLQRILPYLTDDNLKLARATSKCIGNYIAKCQASTQHLISLNIFDYIEKSLQHRNSTIRQQACWMLSNLAYSSKEVFIRDKMISRILIMLFEDRISIKKEIIFVLANLSLNCGSYQIEQFFIENEIFNVMMEMLKLDDVSIVLSVLKNLYNMLYCAKERSKEELIKNQLEKNGNIKVIENLQRSQSDQIYKYASKILTKFFDCEIVSSE